MTLQELMQLTSAVTKDTRMGLDYRKLLKKSLPDFKSATEKELYDLRDEIIKAMEARQKKADQEGRDKSEDEEKSFSACDAVLNIIDRHIDYRKAEGIEGGLTIPEGPFGGSRSSNTNFAAAVQTRTGATGKPDYRSVCVGNHAAPLSGANVDVDKFLTNVMNGIHEERTMIAGSGPLSGYDIPEVWWGSMVSRAIEKMFVLLNCTTYQFPDAGNVLHIPAWDDYNHQEGMAGGINGVWIGENSTNTPQDARLRMVTLTLRKLALYIDASREALEDGITLQTQLDTILRNAISYGLDYAFLRGSGIGQPSGALNSASRVTVNRDTANLVKYADVVNLYSKMHPAGYDNAVWVASQSVLPQLLTLTDAGSHNIWVPSGAGSISQQAPSTLLGRPIYFSEKTPTLGSEGDLSFIDFSQYVVAMKRGAIIERSNAPQWAKDLVSFRIIVRCDGAPLWDKALTLKDGTEVSWCVSLK